jgi:flagellar biosynthesis GTPase FlhF
MDSTRRTRPSVDGQPMVISAPTLKDAYRKIKAELGDDAVILGSRSVTRRQAVGLGNERLVEVIVQAGGTPRPRGLGARRPASARVSQPGTSDSWSKEITREVDRIEELVQVISRQYEDRDRKAAIFHDNPLAEALVASGARPSTVEKFLTRFTSETGNQAGDRVAAITWLTENLRASNCEWDGFYGCHAFLGRPGCGRTSMIYQAAAKLQELGRRTLVLSIMPEHKGEVRRLQAEASRLGFDAAVIQRENQLAKSEAHLARYDAVLVDLPAFGNPSMALGGPLHTWLATNPSFHRHLVLPLESDPDDLVELSLAVKDWHGDWVAVSRCDVSRRQGKFLDFSDLIPLPYSLIGERTGQEVDLKIAGSGDILDRVLGRETPGPVTEQQGGQA